VLRENRRAAQQLAATRRILNLLLLAQNSLRCDPSLRRPPHFGDAGRRYECETSRPSEASLANLTGTPGEKRILRVARGATQRDARYVPSMWREGL
jgi:hypothetical protein